MVITCCYANACFRYNYNMFCFLTLYVEWTSSCVSISLFLILCLNLVGGLCFLCVLLRIFRRVVVYTHIYSYSHAYAPMKSIKYN